MEGTVIASQTVMKGSASAAATLTTLAANSVVQIYGIVHRDNGTNWYNVMHENGMGFIPVESVTVTAGLMEGRFHTNRVTEPVAKKQFNHASPSSPQERLFAVCTAYGRASYVKKIEAIANIQV